MNWFFQLQRDALLALVHVIVGASVLARQEPVPGPFKTGLYHLTKTRPVLALRRETSTGHFP